MLGTRPGSHCGGRRCGGGGRVWASVSVGHGSVGRCRYKALQACLPLPVLLWTMGLWGRVRRRRRPHRRALGPRRHRGTGCRARSRVAQAGPRRTIPLTGGRRGGVWNNTGGGGGNGGSLRSSGRQGAMWPALKRRVALPRRRRRERCRGHEGVIGGRAGSVRCHLQQICKRGGRVCRGCPARSRGRRTGASYACVLWTCCVSSGLAPLGGCVCPAGLVRVCCCGCTFAL